MDMEPEQKLIEAFQLMWGSYPEPVRLIRKDFTVVAGNDLYLKTGGQINTKCNVGDPAMHKGCQAQAALREQAVRRMDGVIDGVNYPSYWIPVHGSAEYYIHYTDGMTALMEKMTAAQGGQPEPAAEV